MVKTRKIIICLTLFFIGLFTPKLVFAHETLLYVEYDNCSPKTTADSDGNSDGEDETWYVLYNVSDNSNNHLY